MPAAGVRLDQWLTRYGYAETRSRAQWLIDTGQVWVNGQQRCKPAFVVPDNGQVEIRGRGLPYVSRGGLKLEHALQVFGVPVRGLVALDVGASTGGFTDCLLQHGAQRVYALDVGTGQLAAVLRDDPRVVVLEGHNLRTFQAAALGESVDLITVDVSYISLTLVLPLLPPFLRPGGLVVALVKPQFEVGAKHVEHGGVVRDVRHRQSAVVRALNVARAMGFHVLQTAEAPRSHTQGNREVLAYLCWKAHQAPYCAFPLAGSPGEVQVPSPLAGAGQDEGREESMGPSWPHTSPGELGEGGGQCGA
jgi:23S rRNA (cytidine1920-2'-O)/16S rRNA (cytidine1409-2'-O)-methyltransferase